MTGQPPSERMTVAAFLEWAARRPEGERWELIDGEPVPTRGPTPAHAIAAETVTHGRIKRRIDHALTEALAKGGHGCEVFVSGPKVQIDADTAFEPDVVVSCVDVPEGLLVPEPLIGSKCCPRAPVIGTSRSSSRATPRSPASRTICWSRPGGA